MVWIPDETAYAGRNVLDTPDDACDVAGHERTRTDLWGSEAARALGATFLPQLADTDLQVEPGQLALFQRECEVLLAHAAELSVVTGFKADYIAARLSFIVQAVQRAQALGGGVLIW